MKQIYRYDENGAFVEPVIIYPAKDGAYNIPKNCTDKPLPQPNWKPVYRNGKWTETATEDERGAHGDKPAKSELDLLREELAELKRIIADLANERGGLDE